MGDFILLRHLIIAVVYFIAGIAISFIPLWITYLRPLKRKNDLDELELRSRIKGFERRIEESIKEPTVT